MLFALNIFNEFSSQMNEDHQTQTLVEKSSMLKYCKSIFCASLIIINFSVNVFSQSITTCGKTNGHSIYHFSGILPKKDSGFTKDEITSGKTTLQKMSDGSYDIYMVDARNKIISLVQDGGKVILLRKGKNDATFLHLYPGMVIELYSFYVDNDGISRYDLLQSKGGDGMLIHKSSVLSGLCDKILFNLID